ncbi:RNA-binding S4 domain-containing protein [Algihabitans albus]|uniref:RNA-binding S4 domain-containing protein n=1 Tax=Algihabitans albus TaxID=2164067 RepID=UPI001F207767|nr:RNA-binding S4 domain-containing protein [Algihabitans albus]
MAKPPVEDGPIKADGGGMETLRLDKWLFFARFFKSRALAAKLCDSRKLRLSGTVIDKAHAKLRIGDVLTFPQGDHVRVIKVLALASRRGPAPEAQALYEDLDPPSEQPALSATSGRSHGHPAAAARPGKRDRRKLLRFKASDTP